MSALLEKHIVQLLKDRDEKGMSLLYDYYGETLLGVAYKVTKDRDLAKDILQESLIKVWNKIESYDASKAKLFTWLFRITRNTAIDRIRSISKKNDQEIQIEVSNVYSLGVNSTVPEHMDVQKHLSTIEEKYQIVLEALFFKGMTQQEASEALNMPLGTVKSRLKIGLRELRKIFKAPLLLLMFWL